jgi:hypothetical protein
MHLKKSTGVIASTLAALSASAAFAATTPYDLIRPTWPLSWDETAISKFDTSVTKRIGVLNIPATPESYKAGALMPDTLDQAYLDAINTKISPIRVNQAGYLKSDKERQFYYVGTAKDFEVVDAAGKSLKTKVKGTFTPSGVETASDWTIIAGWDAASADQERYKIDFTGQTGIVQIGNIPESAPTDKRLRIKVGDDISSTFIISDDVYTMAKDAALKFLGIQRSGNSDSWFHGPSHMKDGAGKVVVTEGYKTIEADAKLSLKAGDLQGGWYDCGDHLKESQTQAFAFMALAVMSATNPDKDVDHYAYNHAEFVKTDKVPDVLREAKHGADFFLRAYRVAKGVIDNMPVSVGNFGSDHGWWGRPEAQDYVNVTGRGGPEERDVRLGELGSNISGMIAAGLAILSKDYAKYDKKFADSCLTVAEKMYDFAKSLAQGKSKYDGDKTFKNNKVAAGWSTPAYNGNNEFTDDMALASVALLYATGKEEYADDMIRTKDLYKGQEIGEGAGFFEGGWFATPDKAFLKGAKNTSWANSHSYALYALYKLILSDSKKAKAFGLTEEERLAAIEDCLADMIANLGDMGGSGTASIELPTNKDIWKSNTVKYDPTWYQMETDQTWNYNRYQMGNIFEVLAYAEVAADIEKQGIKLPTLATTSLKASDMRQLGINQLNYIFGVNPWDISFVYGVGDKNDAHPHHRAANPEGKNIPSLNYKYVCPVGGLLGGLPPSEKNNTWEPNTLSWEDYHISETCLDGSAILTSVLTFVSNGGSDYYEKKCDNCKTDEPVPYYEGVYATAYRYEDSASGFDFFNIGINNSTMEDLDSVVIYIYFDATEEDVESCGVAFEEDICQAYDMAGFNKPCNNDDEIINSMRINNLQKVDGTYNKKKKTYTWEKAIPVGDIALGTRIRFDMGISSGLESKGKCETLRQPAKVNVADGWSFTDHPADKDAPAYEGTPTWAKDYGDTDSDVPKDPYIVLRSKGKLLWGYGPGETTSDRVGFVAPKTTIAKARMQVSHNKLHVQASAQGTKTVKIFDMLGNQLLAQNFDGTRAEVDLAQLPHRGALIARVMQNGKTLAMQSIKVK